MVTHSIAQYGVTVLMGFLAIMNPVANTPVFLSLTEGDDTETIRKVAFRSLALAFLIIFVFSLFGKMIFELFGITLPALRITGGLLVFLIGFHMLQGNASSIHHPSAREKQGSLEAELSVAVSPLAMPILAGPGTIATAMNFSARGGYAEVAVTVATFAAVCGITYVTFLFGERFVRYIGASAMGMITRMMGLILAVIGTQMALEGIRSAFASAG